MMVPSHVFRKWMQLEVAVFRVNSPSLRKIGKGEDILIPAVRNPHPLFSFDFVCSCLQYRKLFSCRGSLTINLSCSPLPFPRSTSPLLPNKVQNRLKVKAIFPPKHNNTQSRELSRVFISYAK